MKASQIKPASSADRVVKTAAVDGLITGLHAYHRIGYDQRLIEFLPNGMIGRGRAGLELRWSLEETGGGLYLLIFSQLELTCKLRYEEEGVWRGRWERFEQMPVEISRIKTRKEIKTLLIQQGSGEAYRDMLVASAYHHADYARRHDIDFWSITGCVQHEREGYWDKIVLIRRALNLAYGLVVWLDADTLICDVSRDLREAACEFEHVGMCRHESGWADWSHLGWHYNSGVIFVKPSGLTRQMFRDVWNAGPHPGNEQQRIMDVWSRQPEAFCAINSIWNAGWASPIHAPMIRAWHGDRGDRGASMAAEVKRLKANP